MPQLDFFSFTHQFLFFSLSFYGLYYFNLLILFPEARWQSLEKFFFLWFLTYDIYIFNRWALGVITMTLNMYRFFLHQSIHKNYLNISFLFFWNVSSVRSPKYPNAKELATLAILSLITLLLFFKNIIVFNAEKLMFIYFCNVVLILFIFLNKSFKNFLKEDLYHLIHSIIILEYKTEHYTNIMWNLARGINNYIFFKTKYSIVINILKTKQIKLN